MKNVVSMNEVEEFKKWWCDENQTITRLVANRLYQYFMEPILDVGAGLGDISYKALFDKEVICIDVNQVAGNQYPLAEKHQRIQIDFFDYVPTKKINTLFISHALQFLDDDKSRLNDKIREIDPSTIVLVLNRNDDILGELIQWSDDNLIPSNPEQRIPGFPWDYKSVDSQDFQAKISCDSFSELAKQLSYIMLFDLNVITLSNLISFLQENLEKPEIEFNQVIEIYTKS